MKLSEKIEKALTDYAKNVKDVDAGWNVLRYWKQGHLTFESGKLPSAGENESADIAVLRWAQSGYLKVSDLVL